MKSLRSHDGSTGAARRLGFAFACAIIAGAAAPAAQLLPTLDVPDWVGRISVTSASPGSLVINGVALWPDSTSTQEELPGLGHKFELLGVMMRDTDPENSVGNPGGSGGGVGGNEVISADMTPEVVALAFRNLPPGVKITAFENQLGFKHYFVAPRSCSGGSPRLTLLIDADGDGTFDQSSGDFAAHGHPAPFQLCPPNTWKYEDLTDNIGRWEVTPGGAAGPTVPVFPFVPWDTLEAAVMAVAPNHKVFAGFLVDDSCSFSPAACGKAYYDLVTIENRTLEIWQDTVKK
jgi:hypothetical protein